MAEPTTSKPARPLYTNVNPAADEEETLQDPSVPAEKEGTLPNPPVSGSPASVGPSRSEPAAQPEPEPKPAEPPPRSPSNVFGEFNLVIGGRHALGLFDVHFRPDAEPFHRAAPAYNGGSIFVQPSFTITEGKRSDPDLRVGVNLEYHNFYIPPTQGSKSSSVNALSLGAMIEGNYFFTKNRELGAGANLNFGYLTYSSSDADVGAPVTATFDLFKEGNFAVGGQIYFSGVPPIAGNGIPIRLGASFTWMFSPFRLGTGEGNTDLLVEVNPIPGLFIAANF